MAIKDLPFGTLEEFNVVVEISKGSQDKFEYDEKLDVIKLDRVLYGAQRFPFNYGFIPETRALDGDHADAVLFTTNPINPGIVVEARAIGMIEMIDSGEVDNKIVCVATKDPRFSDVMSMDDFPAHIKTEIQNFLETYKTLQKKTVEIKGWDTADRARQEITTTNEAYKKESH